MEQRVMQLKMPTRKYAFKRHHEYVLRLYLQPGLWMTELELKRLKRRLDHVHAISGRTYHYGLFDPANTPEDLLKFFSKSTFCILELGNEPVGFVYNVILREGPKPAIHAGLAVIAKNTGINLLRVPYMHLAVLQYQEFGSHFYTNISAVPSAIGGFGDTFSDVWPHYKSGLLKPPTKEYLSVLSLLYREYIDPYFPKGRVEVDTKRFVMRSPAREMGFEEDPHKLSRHRKLEANLFCTYWLDYSKGEDIIQIGRVEPRCIFKIRLYLAFVALHAKLRGLLRVFRPGGTTVEPVLPALVLPQPSEPEPRNETSEEVGDEIRAREVS